MMPSSSSFAAHARFLRILVEREEMKSRQGVRMDSIHSTLQAPLKLAPYPSTPHSTSPVDRQPHPNGTTELPEAPYHYPHYGQPQQAPPLVSPEIDKPSMMAEGNLYPATFPGQTHADHAYYNTMCRELGVTQGVDLIHESTVYNGLPQQPYTMMGT